MLKEVGNVLVEGQGKFVFFQDLNKPEVRTEPPFFWARYNDNGEVQQQSVKRYNKLSQAIDSLTAHIRKTK